MMNHKIKISILVCINAALLLIIILGIIFNPQRTHSRSDMYSWFDRKNVNDVAEIRIINSEYDILLNREENEWFVKQDDVKLPARKLLIDDFFIALCKNSNYPVYSTSEESHEKLLLTDNASIRIILTGNEKQSLLDMYVGLTDVTGRNVFLRKQGFNEVRSGIDIFSVFATSDPVFWYNLLLIPETETGYIDASSVKSLTVYPPENKEPMVFTSAFLSWELNFYSSEPDIEKIDSFIQDILNSSADDFAIYKKTSDPDLNDCRIVIEFVDDSIRIISLGPVMENGNRYASVSVSDLVYIIPEWIWQKFFPDITYFSM